MCSPISIKLFRKRLSVIKHCIVERDEAKGMVNKSGYIND
jgi:hypothetical protein